MRRHHTYARQRCDLWIGHRVDRDRTTTRIELGRRAADAITRQPTKERQ